MNFKIKIQIPIKSKFQMAKHNLLGWLFLGFEFVIGIWPEIIRNEDRP
jgi:hypothetical protein